MKSNFKQGGRILILITINILYALNVYSQHGDQSFRKIQYVYDETGNFVEEMKFYNEGTKQLANSFNLIENNPYNSLPYPVIKDKILSYDLSGVRLNDIMLRKGKLNITFGVSDTVLLRNIGATSFSGVYEDNSNYSIVCYYLNVGGEDNIVAYSAIIYVFNCEGGIVKEIDDIEAPVSNQLISRDGRYLAVGYGSTMDLNNMIVSNDGCLIYDLITDDIIDHKSPDGFSWTVPMIIDNLIVVVHENSNEYYYYVYDFEKNKKYSHVFERREFINGQLKDITKEGFIFNLDNKANSEKKTVRYSNEFKVEDIK